MKHRKWLWAVLPLLLVVVVAYSNLAFASNQPLVDGTWDGSFYKSVSANGDIVEFPFSNAMSNLTPNLGNSPVFKFPHYPWIYLLTGNPPTKVTGDTNPGGLTADDPTVIPATGDVKPATGDIKRATGDTKPPITIPVLTTCPNSKFVAASGLPFGPVTLSWSPVPGATKYVAAVFAKGLNPNNPAALLVLASASVNAPTTQVVLTLDAVMVQKVIDAGGSFVIGVNPQTKDGGICVIFRTISTRPKTQPTLAPTVPSTEPGGTGSVTGGTNGTNPTGGNTTGGSTTGGGTTTGGTTGRITGGSTTIIIIVPTPCPPGYRGDPANGVSCVPIPR